MNQILNSPSDFRRSIRAEFNQYVMRESNRFNAEDCLKIDLHCHDHNSDKPDELWGRILGLPETWLKTKKLVKQLRKQNCNVITITNHNNAKSCWDLIEKGYDILSAAEFTCYFPEYELFAHVLTYGFSPQQEAVLNEKRQNIYEFLRYAAKHDLPVILPHPLYFYTRNEKIDLALFEKLAVMFQRFEVLNGQRDLWQSVLTLNWVQGLTADKIRAYAKKHGLNPEDFGVNPDQPKVLTGGSDDHMGIFAGECGSYLYVPDLKGRLKHSKRSELALEALRLGNVAPYGQVMENQKLNIALLSYFSQIATRIEDPGLLRIMLHRGEAWDKIACFAISNLMLEMQKHKYAMKFFSFVEEALQGKKPGKLLKWKINKDYRFCIAHLERIADSRNGTPEEFVETVNQSIAELFKQLNLLIVKRAQQCNLLASEHGQLQRISTEEITRKFEVPSQVSALIFGAQNKKPDMSNLKVGKLVDKLSFPLLISMVLMGTHLTSTRVLYQNRQFLNTFADHIGKAQHQKRALYLTDTLKDKNGVSHSLSGKLAEIQRQNLPVDFLICHADEPSTDHLHVVRPLTSVSFPQFGEQEIRIPDIMEIARIFYEGGYDRVICSTEGPMGLVSLFLRYMFNVPCYFFMHTDWIDFIMHTTDLTQHERDRIRRALRMMYKLYDGVFVLNSDHREWLIGHEMELEEDTVFLTAHHTRAADASIKPIQKADLFPDIKEDTPVLFIACRVSKEKGVLDLPAILDRARQAIPDLKIVIAGSGPAEEELKARLPDALFLGWVDHSMLARCYAGLDLFVFPSRFDTFGNVILEAFSYGMPVVAYNCKGPKDIVEHGLNGYLVNELEDMGERIVHHFSDRSRSASMRQQAIRRAGEYLAEPIMEKFMQDLGLAEKVKKVASIGGVAA